MIKSQIYIRKLTPEQKKQLEVIASEQKLKNGTDVFFHILEQYNEHKNEIARLKRINEYKQKKINRQENYIDIHCQMVSLIADGMEYEEAASVTGFDKL